METKEKEIFKDVPGYENCYQVSNRGNLRSLDRTVVCKDGRECFYKGRVMQGSINKGYRKFTLSINGEGRNFAASQLVAAAFLNHNPDGHTFVVDHIDGDTSNDRVENLRIVTHRENTSTCYRSNKETFSSKYAGVHWDKKDKKWYAQIRYEGARPHLGYYDDELEAYQAYKKALAKIKDGTFNVEDYKPKWSSKYKGISFNKANNKWRSYVDIERKRKHVGYFNTEIEAYEAYQDALARIEDGTFNPDEYKPNFTSKYQGVSWVKRDKKWVSYTRVNDKRKHIGYFNTELEAYNAIQKFKQEVKND